MAVRRRSGVATALLVATTCAGCLNVQTDPPPHPVAAIANARLGGTLTVGIVAPTAIDPALVPAADTAGTLVLRTMCDSLFATDPVTGDLRPDIASHVQVTGNGTVITITLRRGVRFSDGARLTAADVVGALTRVARPAVASPNADALATVGGFAAMQQSDAKHPRLLGVSAPDPLSVQIVLSAPDAEFARVLTTAVGVPIPRHHADDNGFGTFSADPVCVGPYRLAAPWRPGDPQIVLVRSRHYSGGSPGDTRAGAGWADRIVFRIYADTDATLAAYEHGQVDIAAVTPARAERVRRDVGSASVVSAPTATLGYIGLPTTVPPFDDRSVRTALSMALDRSAIVRTVYGGGRSVATGLYPPAVGDAFYRPAACGSSVPAAASLVAARQLMAGRLAGKTFPFYFDDEFANRALVTAVAGQWERAFRVRFRLVPMDFQDYLQKVMQAPGLDGPFRLSYASPAASPADYVRDLLASSSIDTSNATRFVDPPLDQALVHQVLPAQGRRAVLAWHAVETEFCTKLPLLPVTDNDLVWAWRGTAASALGDRLNRATALPLLRDVFRIRP